MRIASTSRMFQWLGIALIIGYLPRVSSCAWLWLGIALVIGYSPHVLRILLVHIFGWVAVHHCRLYRQCIVVVLVVVAFRQHPSHPPYESLLSWLSLSSVDTPLGDPALLLPMSSLLPRSLSTTRLSPFQEHVRPCPQAQFFSHKNIKTYLSHPKKVTFGGLPGVALSRG
jgi:hypothetical protein